MLWRLIQPREPQFGWVRVYQAYTFNASCRVFVGVIRRKDGRTKSKIALDITEGKGKKAKRRFYAVWEDQESPVLEYQGDLIYLTVLLAEMADRSTNLEHCVSEMVKDMGWRIQAGQGTEKIHPLLGSIDVRVSRIRARKFA